MIVEKSSLAYLLAQLPGQGFGRVGGHSLERSKPSNDDAELGRRGGRGRKGRGSAFAADVVTEAAAAGARGCIGGCSTGRGGEGGGGAEEGRNSIVGGRRRSRSVVSWTGVSSYKGYEYDDACKCLPVALRWTLGMGGKHCTITVQSTYLETGTGCCGIKKAPDVVLMAKKTRRRRSKRGSTQALALAGGVRMASGANTRKARPRRRGGNRLGDFGGAARVVPVRRRWGGGGKEAWCESWATEALREDSSGSLQQQ